MPEPGNEIIRHKLWDWDMIRLSINEKLILSGNEYNIYVARCFMAYYRIRVTFASSDGPIPNFR